MFYSNPSFLSSFCSYLFWSSLSFFVSYFRSRCDFVRVLVCCFTKKITRIAPLSYHHPIEYHHHQFHNKITSHHRLMVSGAWLVTLVLASPQAVIFRWWKVLHRFRFTSFLPQGPQTSYEGLSPGMKKYKITRLGNIDSVFFSYLVEHFLRNWKNETKMRTNLKHIGTLG